MSCLQCHAYRKSLIKLHETNEKWNFDKKTQFTAEDKVAYLIISSSL